MKYYSPDFLIQCIIYYFIVKNNKGKGGLKRKGSLLTFFSWKGVGLIKMGTDIIWQGGLINGELTIILILSLPWQHAMYKIKNCKVIGYVGNFTKKSRILIKYLELFMRISEIKLCSYFEIRVKTMYTLSLIQTVVSC